MTTLHQQRQHQQQHGRTAETGQPASHPHCLSEAECRDIARRLAQVTTGGGVTMLTIWSHWTGHVRWARNQLVTSGDVRNNYIRLIRDVGGAMNQFVMLNQVDDVALAAAAQRAERLVGLASEDAEWDLAFKRRVPEPVATPQLFDATTPQLGAVERATAAVALMKKAAAVGMLSAGDIEVSAHSVALLDSLGSVQYMPYTQASYSVTVRDPQGIGSGWAGVDWPAWARIDAQALTQTALEKCLQSRHPVAIEPGRYTTILEPQAVSDFIGELTRDYQSLKRTCAEWDCNHAEGPFNGDRQTTIDGRVYTDLGRTQLGEQVADPRVSIWSDPMDPDLGFVPFSPWIDTPDVYHPAHWITDGVLTQLAYDRNFAIRDLHRSTGLPNQGAFRMSGGETSIAEMIATTKRGLLVTRFDDVLRVDAVSLLYRGYTRDGFWLIEGGKISKPIKNMVFTESILFALNNIEQLGVPQRVYHPAQGRLVLPQPTIVPPLKIKDFSFTALTEAI